MTAIFPYVLLDMAVIILCARVFGRAARALRQPAVIGEIVAGIALGPSLLGQLPGDLYLRLFPVDAQPYLRILAQLGIVLFMFIVGMELEFILDRDWQGDVGVISLLSIAVPFILGALLTLCLYPLHSSVDGNDVPLSGFMLFMGVAMSVTAFPVLARILTERRMNQTRVGVLALSAAAVVDVLAWTLLAFVYAVVKGNSLLAVVRIVVLTTIFVAVMFTVVRPLLTRLLERYRRCGRLTPDILSVILVGILLSALTTAAIGIHEIFGAFLFGAVLPRAEARAFRREISERLQHISVLLLLPIFFVIAGFDVNLRAFADPGLLWQLLLILAVAIAGKFGGSFAGALLRGMDLQHSAVIGVLLNTRGLTELVILLLGKQVGVLDTEMFTMMVVMALITTAATEPLLRLIYPDRAVRRDLDTATPNLNSEHDYRVLVLIDADPSLTTQRMLFLANAALGNRARGVILLSCFLKNGDHGVSRGLGADPPGDLAGVAEAVETLEHLVAQSIATTASVQVVCQFSSAADLDLFRAQTSQADLVVVSEDWWRQNPGVCESLHSVTVLIASSEASVCWLAAETAAAMAVADDAVFVRDDGGPDGARAVVLAARAAKHSGRSLIAITGDNTARIPRRLRQALKPLRSASIDVSVLSVREVQTAVHRPRAAVARVLDRDGGSQIDLRDAMVDLA